MKTHILAGLVALSLLVVSACALPGTLLKSGAPEPGIAFTGELTSKEGQFSNNYEIPVRKGQVVQVALASLDFIPKLELSLGERKTVVEGSGASGGRVASVMLVDADGVLNVRVSGDAAGTFLLKVTPRDMPRLAAGQNEYQGKLASADAVEYVLVELPQTGVSMLVCRSKDFDSTIKVRLPNGMVMTNDDFTGESDAGVILPGGMAGSAMVEIRSYNNEKPGAFTLVHQMAAIAGQLKTGSSVQGRIDAGKGDAIMCYNLSAAAGEQQLISLSSDDFDTVLQVYAGGKLLTENDDISSDNYNSQVLLMGGDQQALLVVRDYETKAVLLP
jgi:hypothetical protein